MDLGWLRWHGNRGRVGKERIGGAIAETVVLREMSLSILGQLESGHSPANEAALVKDLGNSHEQRIHELVRELFDSPACIVESDTFNELQGYLTQTVPTSSLRGGTREILRGNITKGLG